MFIVVSNYYYDISMLCVGLVCCYVHTVLTADCKLNCPAGSLALYLLARTPAAATLVHDIVFCYFSTRNCVEGKQGGPFKTTENT